MNIRIKLKAALILALCLLIIYTLKPATAQAPSQPQDQVTLPTSNSIDTAYRNVNGDVPRNLHTLSQNIFIEILATGICQLTGIDPFNSQGQCLGIDKTTGKIGYVGTEGGAIGAVSGMIGYTYNIPASSGDFVSYVAGNFGITKTAYAQQDLFPNGTGFSGLRPLLKIWEGFRNITYLIFVILFTLIGLAIIMRVKVDARTVMTLQNQIPKIVIGLVLVTFSYAIAGFLIDLMYVATYLIIITFNQISPSPNPGIFRSIFSYANNIFQPPVPFGGDFLGIVSITWNVSRNVQQLVTNMFESIIPTQIGLILGRPFIILSALDVACDVVDATGLGNIGSGSGIGGFFGGGCNLAENYPAIIIGSIAQLLAFLIIFIAILYSLFRVWFTLIKAYCFILVDVVIAPFWIVIGLFPGSTFGFGKWIRHLIAHLALFPTVIGILLLGKAIMDAIETGGLFDVSGKGDLFAPPLLGNIGGNNVLAAFVGLGFILSIPQLLERVKTALQSPSLGLTSIRQSLNAGNPLSLAQSAGHMGYQIGGLQHLPVVGSLFKKSTGDTPAGGH